MAGRGSGASDADHGMAETTRTLFILSDHTGITLEHLVKTLITQFDDVCCESMVLPFLDSRAKIEAAVREIEQAVCEDEAPPIVFSSIVDNDLRALLKEAKAEIFDIFDTLLRRVVIDGEDQARFAAYLAFLISLIILIEVILAT